MSHLKAVEKLEKQLELSENKALVTTDTVAFLTQPTPQEVDIVYQKIKSQWPNDTLDSLCTEKIATAEFKSLKCTEDDLLLVAVRMLRALVNMCGGELETGAAPG